MAQAKVPRGPELFMYQVNREVTSRGQQQKEQDETVSPARETLALRFKKVFYRGYNIPRTKKQGKQSQGCQIGAQQVGAVKRILVFWVIGINKTLQPLAYVVKPRACRCHHLKLTESIAGPELVKEKQAFYTQPCKLVCDKEEPWAETNHKGRGKQSQKLEGLPVALK